ncbi:MAG TPA: DUF2442 domain-containing protein [Verrucomicrobiae bacterium]|nr:DUF2442 domain-containing protein [Verrucomicrobiae bacterium]
MNSVEYVSGYKLRLGFEDGTVRLVDLAAELDGEIFEPLKDLRIFQTARLNSDLDTVVWSNGADMSPDFLYEIDQPVRPTRQAAHRVTEKKAKYRTKR